MEFSVPMALVDFIPDILFLTAAVLLQRCFYKLMVKGAYSLLAAGTICITAAGFMKAIWKLLYALNVCNFIRLNQVFMPMHTLGFALAGISLAWYAFSGGNGKAAKDKLTAACAGVALAASANASEPAEYSGTMIFITAMVLGLLFMVIGLIIVAKRMHKPAAIVLFVFTFILELMMGYLASRDGSSAMMNWIEELVNTCGQCCLVGGILVLKKAGLGEVAEA